MEKTVLIVEDEQAIVEILKFNLKREGYETMELPPAAFQAFFCRVFQAFLPYLYLFSIR